ncbi:hypothetical protein ITP53_27660, partial [Nonomuraea sp. K274]
RAAAEPARLRAAAEPPADAARLERPAGGDLGGLFGRAAAAVLERKAFDDAHLRAVGTALRLAGDPAVRLGVDGLELAGGSPQSSSDVLDAARRCELFRPEIELAREVAGGRQAHVVVDAGSQLPAAFALVDALGAERVTLCGRFVAEHDAALRRVPELAGVRCLAWSPDQEIRPLWCTGSESGGPGPLVLWVTGTRPPPERGPWAGWLDAARAAAFPDEALGRCQGLTIKVTRIDFLAAVTGMNGMTVNLRRLLAALPSGVPVRCELVVGAPGMPADVVGESLELLADGPGGVRVAGLRAYRMGIRAEWAGQSVRFPPAAGHDLARWLEFDAPDTMRPYEVTAMISRWLDRLPGLLPGRFAACSVAGDTAVDADAWDPCAEVVSVAGTGTFAVSLRSGRSYRLDQGLVEPVTRLAADPRALDDLAESARRRLTEELARAGVLGSGG